MHGYGDAGTRAQNRRNQRKGDRDADLSVGGQSALFGVDLILLETLEFQRLDRHQLAPHGAEQGQQYVRVAVNGGIQQCIGGELGRGAHAHKGAVVLGHVVCLLHRPLLAGQRHQAEQILLGRNLVLRPEHLRRCGGVGGEQIGQPAADAVAVVALIGVRLAVGCLVRRNVGRAVAVRARHRCRMGEHDLGRVCHVAHILGHRRAQSRRHVVAEHRVAVRVQPLYRVADVVIVALSALAVLHAADPDAPFLQILLQHRHGRRFVIHEQEEGEGVVQELVQPVDLGDAAPAVVGIAPEVGLRVIGDEQAAVRGNLVPLQINILHDIPCAGNQLPERAAGVGVLAVVGGKAGDRGFGTRHRQDGGGDVHFPVVRPRGGAVLVGDKEAVQRVHPEFGAELKDHIGFVQGSGGGRLVLLHGGGVVRDVHEGHRHVVREMLPQIQH